MSRESTNLHFLEEYSKCVRRRFVSKLSHIVTRTEIIQRVKHPENVETVCDGLLAEIIDSIVPVAIWIRVSTTASLDIRIARVSNTIGTTDKCLERDVGN